MIKLTYIGTDYYCRLVFKGDNGGYYKTEAPGPRGKDFVTMAKDKQLMFLKNIHTTDSPSGEPGFPCWEEEKFELLKEEEMNENLTDWQKDVERRLSALENSIEIQPPKPPESMELTILLPESDIDGLHFNRQEVKGVFDLKDDIKYHSRNILFLSARNTKDDNSQDILLKYLQSGDVKNLFLDALINAGYDAGGIDVSMPTENEGVKQYNGVSCWYWQQLKSATWPSGFVNVSSHGNAGTCIASAVGGCAPAFSVTRKKEAKNG